MNMKHTPGPWRAGSETGGKGSVVSDQLAVGALSGSDAVAYYGGNLIAESIAQENIPLIAAAPELLDVIIGMMVHARKKNATLFRDSVEMFKAYAAIEKATGSDRHAVNAIVAERAK